MFVFYQNPEKQEHVRLIKMLYDSCRKNKILLNTSQFTSHARLNLASERIIFAGMIRGEGTIYKWCQEREKKFLYIDHAYLHRGYGDSPNNTWMRVTDTGFCWTGLEEKSSGRWDRFFSQHYPLKPWMSNQDKKNILILPPSLSTQWLFPESKLWLQNTLKLLSSYTDREIVIREKPFQPVINHRNVIVGKVKHDHDQTIDEQLNDAYMVATFNSAVAIQATLMGIPVYTSDECAASPMSMNLNYIDAPPEPARNKWSRQLVHHQFNIEEMQSGEIWKMLGLA